MAEAIVELRVTADSPQKPSQAQLQLSWGEDTLALEAGPISIGAHAANHVALDDRHVSGFHCRLVLQHERWFVKDLGSTNGTFLDGMRVAEAELLAGSRLRVGSQELRVEPRAQRRAAPQLPGLLARDPSLFPVLELLRRAAPSELPVMILGESGSGKEVAARAVHELSHRSQGPFVPLNCGAISRELAEAELFGHEKGSFTGAVTSAPGAFGAADCGTLFLDEIGDLPLPLQVKLLRALESQEIKPVGAARPRPIDVRVLCATHRDLRRKVREGSFREDLYYRLRGVTVELLPLRSRPQDILPLAELFLPRSCTLLPCARAALLTHPWPGNVRELRHVVKLAELLGDGRHIRAEHLRFDEARFDYDAPTYVSDNIPEVIDLRGRPLAELQDAAIRAAHARCAGNRAQMVRELKMSKSSLLRRLKALGI